MFKKAVTGFLVFLLILQAGCGNNEQKSVNSAQSSVNTQNGDVISAGSGIAGQDGAVIVNKGNYYNVILDFSKGLSHKEVGKEYAERMKIVLPEIETLVDSFISDITANNKRYQYMLLRARDIRPQIPQNCKDEIEGMASVFSGTENVRGDNKISVDELYFYNLIPDAIRQTQCLVISVFGLRSVTHKTMIARVLDWFGGISNQIAKIQAITTIKYSDKIIYSIGYMGFMGIITGFNNNGVFAAILDSPTGKLYSSQGKRSYPIDLRFALETESDLNVVADYMKDPSKEYTFNHLIFLSDTDESKVLENNFSGKGKNMRRVLRSSDSLLNKGITWGINDSVATVNSFLLEGNHDNHTNDKSNTKRWENIKTQLLSKGNEVTLNELKEVASFHKGGRLGPITGGDLYNNTTQQIVIFEPYTFNLEVFFRPKNTTSVSLPAVPLFEKIPVLGK